MKMKPMIGMGSAVLAVGLFTGCGQSEKPATATESTAAAAAAEAQAPMQESAAVAEMKAMASSPSAAEMQAKAADALASFKLPNLTQVSAGELESTTAQTLDRVAALTQGTGSNSEVTSLVNALKSSLSADQAVDALAKLPELAAAVKTVPGGAEAVTYAKQMVGAWALKQNFDPAMIAPALQALQTGEYAALASQASKWIGTGELSSQQQAILQGLLSNYGLDMPAAEMLNKVKGMF